MLPSDRLRQAIRNALTESKLGVRRFEVQRGLRPWALRGLLDRSREQSPSVDKAEEICSALGLTLQIGGSHAEDVPGKERVVARGQAAPERLRDLETGARALNQLVLDAGGQPFPGGSAITPTGKARDLPGIRWVEVRPLAAAAGGGALIEDEEVEGYLAFRRDWLASRSINPTQCVVIDVMGDSMEPTLPEGSAILVDRAQRRRQAGRIYVIRGEDGLLVKRALRQRQGWVMASDNPAHPPSPWRANAEVIGEVRWLARSIR